MNFSELYPFSSHFVEINGLKYHYIDEGCGDPVLMVHGNPTWSFYFRNLVKKLSPHYRAIVPDHIGCGLSDKPSEHKYDFSLARRIKDLEIFMDSLKLGKPVTLILHDWGGAIGIGYALRHKENVSRIILLNTAAFLRPNGKKLPLRLKLIRNFSFFARLAVLGGNLFVRGALVMAPRKKLEKNVRIGLMTPYDSWNNRMATLKFVQDIPLFPGDPSYSLLKSIDHELCRLSGIPMMICWGIHDFVFDLDYLKEWQRRFPYAIIKKYPESGHYLLEDEPEKISNDILNFLKTDVS